MKTHTRRELIAIASALMDWGTDIFATFEKVARKHGVKEDAVRAWAGQAPDSEFPLNVGQRLMEGVRIAASIAMSEAEQ